MAMATREKIQSAIIQIAEQEKQLLIEIQKLQQNAVLLDGLLESLDEGNKVSCSLLPKPVVIEVKKQYTDTLENVKKRFTQAIASGNIKEVSELLQDGRIDPSECNNAAIRMASFHNHLAIVNLLLQDSLVDPSDRNNSAIGSASRNGHLAVVDRLLQEP
jgi:hypothetical protein